MSASADQDERIPGAPLARPPRGDLHTCLVAAGIDPVSIPDHPRSSLPDASPVCWTSWLPPGRGVAAAGIGAEQ
jgi:hypothetical protein